MMGQGNGGRVVPATTAEKIRELAERLHRGVGAIREGRVDATIHDLVAGALRSMHVEAAARRTPNHQAKIRMARAARGLCLGCGRREVVRSCRYCARCLLRERVRMARRKGQIPHVKHPAPKEEAWPRAGAGLPATWEGRESA